jgi:hypothetical protein
MILDRERQMNKLLSVKVQGFEKQSLAAKSKPKDRDSNSSSIPEVKQLRERLATANRKIEEGHIQVASIRSDLIRVQKLLVSEVGDGMGKTMNKGWKGRAEQIYILKVKSTSCFNCINRIKSCICKTS